MKFPDKKALAIIPSRSGSKRIPQKNIKKFMGLPLIAHTIKQALQCTFINRIIVDTDSEQIARIAVKYGAEVPFLRPPRLARDSSQIVQSIIYMLNRLKKNGYAPDFIIILQTTSPLREIDDIKNCWDRMLNTDATTVLTVCPTHPQLYYLTKGDEVLSANRIKSRTSNTHLWRPAYMFNGCFVYIVRTSALLKEKRIPTKKTKAIICPKWRSVDLDTAEEWVIAELLFKNKDNIVKRIKNLTEESTKQ